MRLDPTQLTAVGAVTKVGFDNAAAKSKAVISETDPPPPVVKER